MKLSEVLLVAGKELRETLRDRRTLAVMVLFPLVVYPVVSLATVQVLSARIGRTEKTPARVAVTGPRAGADELRGRLAAARHDGRPDFELSPATAPATAAEVRAGSPRRGGRAASAGHRGRAAAGDHPVRRNQGTFAHRARTRSRRRSGRRRAELRRGLRRQRRGRRAQDRDGRLPAVEGPAAHHRGDGAGGRLSSRHRHHRRRARARHAGDDAVGAHPARRADDRQGGGGRDAGGAERVPQPRVDVDHGARGRQAGRGRRGRVAALGERRGRRAAGDPGRRVPVRVGDGRARRAGAQLQGGADAADAGLFPVHGAVAARGAGRLRARRRGGVHPGHRRHLARARHDRGPRVGRP